MSNTHRGRVSVEVNGQSYTLAASINALCELEDLLSTPEAPVTFQQVLAKAAAGSMKHARALYWALLRDGHPDMTLADVGNWMTSAGPALEGVFESVMQSSRPEAADVKALGMDKRPRRARAGLVNGTGGNSKSRPGASV